MANAAKRDLRQFNINCRLSNTANQTTAWNELLYGLEHDWKVLNAAVSCHLQQMKSTDCGSTSP